MFADTSILGIFFVLYFFYSFFDLIKDCIYSLAQGPSRKKKPSTSAITEEMMKEAMQNKKFGDFELTPAVVFFKDGDIMPSEGYKTGQFVGPDGLIRSRMIVSASAEKVLDIFDEFISLVGDKCNVVVEDFRTGDNNHLDYFAYDKDTYIVRSVFFDFEEFFLNDGFFTIAIWNEMARAEVQLTSQKVIQVFAEDITGFESSLASFGIEEDPELRFFFEEFYMLISTENGASAIEALKDRLCVDHSAIHKSDPPEMAN